MHSVINKCNKSKIDKIMFARLKNTKFWKEKKYINICKIIINKELQTEHIPECETQGRRLQDVQITFYRDKIYFLYPYITER